MLTFGLGFEVDFGLLVATLLLALVLDLTTGDPPAFPWLDFAAVVLTTGELPVFACTLGLDFAAVVLELGLGCARALSTASRPIRLPVTYEGCEDTSAGIWPGPFATESLPSKPFPLPDSSNLSLCAPVYFDVSVIRSRRRS